MSVLRLVVRHSVELADGVRELALVRPDDGPLPAHPAGSHLIVDCGDRRNAYSLTNSGAQPHMYTVAVLHRSDGLGGSARMHRVRPGEEVTVSTPRSGFPPVRTARRHLLVAGGIGITPLLAHARDAVRWGRDVELLYVHRPARGAYRAELADLLGGRLHATTDRTVFGRTLATALISQPLGTHLYLCGPAALSDRVLADAAAAGWPPQRLHRERFVPTELDAGHPFVARLARSGRDIVVPAGTSLLDALHGAGVPVPNLCRHGVCGACLVGVVAGRPHHRDVYLTASERTTGDAVMCCVSRSETDTLELDL